MNKPKSKTKPKKKERVLMLNYEFPPVGGGGGVASKQLAKGLKRFEKIDDKNLKVYKKNRI
jgi:hypothetical protein